MRAQDIVSASKKKFLKSKKRIADTDNTTLFGAVLVPLLVSLGIWYWYSHSSDDMEPSSG